MPTTELTPKAERMAFCAIQRILQSTHGDVVADILQESKLAAFQKSAQFRGQSSYTTWFYRIASNRALMYKRKYKHLEREVRVYDMDCGESCWQEHQKTIELIPSAHLNPEERMLALERNQQLTRAILQLSPKLREAILRFAIGDRRQGPKTVAEPQLTNTQKARKFRAIRELRELLEGVL